jgi:hypothetical protein
MVTMWGGWLLLLDFHYFAALVLSAVRAHAVRQFGLMAVGTFGHPGSFQRIVRAARLGAPGGVASFRIRHFISSKCFQVLQTLQGSPPAAGMHVLAIARRFIAVGAARRTDPFTILAANTLHGHYQQDLLA